MMNGNTGAVLINLGLFALIGISIWITKSPWCLWALLFVFSSDKKKVE